MPWNFDNSIPIYLQIIDEIQRKILSGELKPREKLPSIRDLAKEAKVNPNTMQKALQELENQGLIESERTTGKFITQKEAQIKKLREEYLKEKLLPCIKELTTLGLTKDELHALIDTHMKEGAI